MEKGPDKRIPGLEEQNKAFVKRLVSAFDNVKTATITMAVLTSTTDLNDYMHTRGFGFKDEQTLFALVLQLDKQTSPEIRGKILLDTLADPEKCNLEKEFLDALRKNIK